jgi:hypothetical protein
MKSLSHLQVLGNEYDAEEVFDMLNMNVSGSEEDSISAKEDESDDIVDKDRSVRNDHLSI